MKFSSLLGTGVYLALGAVTFAVTYGHSPAMTIMDIAYVLIWPLVLLFHYIIPVIVVAAVGLCLVLAIEHFFGDKIRQYRVKWMTRNVRKGK